MKAFLAAMVALAILAGGSHTVQASSTSLYISTSGSDAASCSTNFPCLTLVHATSLATPGSTIYMTAGTYPAQTITVNGTTASPVTIEGEQGVTLTYPLNATAAQQSAPLLSIVHSANIVVQGIAIVGMIGRSDIITSSPVTSEIIVSDTLTGGSGIIISSTVVDNSTGGAIAVLGGEAVTVTDSSFVSDGTPSLPTIWIPAQNSVVSRVMIESTNGPGIWVAGLSGTSGPFFPSIVMSNTIYNPSAVSGSIAISGTGNGIIIAANNVFGTDGGIYIAGDGARLQENVAQQDYNISVPDSYSVGSGTGVGVYNNYSTSSSGLPHSADLLIGATSTTNGTIVENNQFVGGQYNTSIMTTTMAHNSLGDYNEYSTWPSNPAHPSSAPVCAPTDYHTGTPVYGYCPDTQGNILYASHSFSDTSLSVAISGWPSVNKEMGTWDPTTLLYTSPPAQAAGINVGIPILGNTPDVGPFCILTCVYTTTYYLSPVGLDSNPCTQSLPCQSPNRVAWMTRPGDLIWFEPGTYYGPYSFNIATSGTAQWPVTYAATPQSVIFTYPISASSATQASSLWLDQGIYKIFSGIEFLGMVTRTDWIPQHYTGPMGNDLISFPSTPTHITLQNVTVLDSESTAFGCYDFCAIYNSTFINDAWTDQDANLHPIYISGSRNIVANSFISGTAGYDLHFHNAGGSAGNNLIINNTIIGANNAGIVADSGPVTITNNIIINNRGGGIQLGAGGGGVIYHNLFLDNGSPGSNGDISASSFHNTIVNNTFYHSPGQGNPQSLISYCQLCVILNNIFINTSSALVSISGGPNTMAGNIIWADGMNVLNNPSGYTNSPSYTGDGIVLADPLFTNVALPQTGGLSLSPGSPAIGDGVPIPTNLLPYYAGFGGTAPDSGYYCYNCGSVVPVTHVSGPQTYYLSPSGADGVSACTQSAPCGNLLNVETMAHAGDNVVLLSGTYTLPLYITVPNISIEGRGGVTLTYPITTSASFSSQQVADSRFEPRVVFIDAFTDTLASLIIDGGSATPGYVTDGDLTPLLTTVVMNSLVKGDISLENVTLQNNQSTNVDQVCLLFNGVGGQIINSLISNCLGVGNFPNQNFTITDSSLLGFSQFGIDMASVGPLTTTGQTPDVFTFNTLTGPNYRANYSLAVGGISPLVAHNNFLGTGNPLQLYGPSGAIIANNYFDGVGGYNGQMGAIDDAGTNDMIINNTIIASPFAIALAVGGGMSNGVIVKNNIYQVGYGYPFWRVGTSFNATGDYNLIDSPGQTSSLISTTADANNNQFYLSHDIFAGAQMANTGVLQPTSPAVQSGVNVGLPYQSPAPDRGSIPYRSAFDTNLPISLGGKGTGINPTILLLLLGVGGSSAIGFYGLAARLGRSGH